MKTSQNQLSKEIKKLAPYARIVFGNISYGMEYNYKLKYLKKFTEFLDKEQKEENERLGVYCDFLINNWKIETFDWTDTPLAFTGISDQRRVQLGVTVELFYFLSSVKSVKKNDDDWIEFSSLLKNKIPRNSLKTWYDFEAFISPYESENHIIDYDTHWQQLMPLNNMTFIFKEDTYTINFPKSSRDLVSYGYEFHTCLKMGSWGEYTSSGRNLMLIVFKNNKLFSSLSIKPDPVLQFKVTNMSSYNNKRADAEIYEIFQNKVNSLISHIKIIPCLPELANSY